MIYIGCSLGTSPQLVEELVPWSQTDWMMLAIIAWRADRSRCVAGRVTTISSYLSSIKTVGLICAA